MRWSTRLRRVNAPPGLTSGEYFGPFTMPANEATIAKALFVGRNAVRNHLGALYDKYEVPRAETGDEPRYVRLARVAYFRGPVGSKDYVKGVV